MKYEFPVKLHRFTTEEFNKKKAEYNAKYGYTIHIPGFTDIVRFETGTPPSELEIAQYKAKDVSALGQGRYNQIKFLMAKKRESFLRMMSSPNPTWLNNIGTSMTLLDDINDAAGTLSVVTRLGAHLLPKVLGKLLMGPAGWALMAADIAQVGMTVMRSPLSKLTRKTALGKASATNPFCKEARVERANRLKRIKPTKGEVIEGLQVTNSLFGIGLSLGPIVGAFEEAFTGAFMALSGKKVRVKWPLKYCTSTEFAANLGIQAAQQLNTGGQELADEDHIKSYMVANMATQVLYPLFKAQHPLDVIDGIENIMLKPREVTDPLTKEILTENKISIHDSVGFLHGKRGRMSAGELMDIGLSMNRNSFLDVTKSTKHTMKGWIGAQSVNDLGQNGLALLEGEDQVKLDLHPVIKAIETIMDRGLRFGPETTREQLSCFAEVIMSRYKNNWSMEFRDLREPIVKECKIVLTQE